MTTITDSKKDLRLEDLLRGYPTGIGIEIVLLDTCGFFKLGPGLQVRGMRDETWCTTGRILGGDVPRNGPTFVENEISVLYGLTQKLNFRSIS